MPADADQGGGTTTVTAAWDPSSVLQESTEIAGPCFTFNSAGEPLEPGP